MALLAIGVALAAIIAAVWAFDPSAGSFPFPRCPFKWLTGWDCPGCGSTRALHAALHGRLAEALGFNAALIVALPLLGTIFLAERFGNPRLRRIFLSPTAAAVILLLAILWTIIRNL